MKKMLLGVLAAAAIAACGSKAAPPTTPIPDPVGDGHADHDHDADKTPPPDGTGDGHTDGSGDQPPIDPPPPDPAKIKAALLAAETTAYEQAKPVFGKYCAGCHQQGGKKASAKKLGHLDITTYPFAGHHTMEVAITIRKALAIGGGKATMPFDKPGLVKGDELALIAAWADAFDASHAGGAHEGMAGHDGHH